VTAKPTFQQGMEFARATRWAPEQARGDGAM